MTNVIEENEIAILKGPATTNLLDIATTFQQRINLPIITAAGLIFIISLFIRLALKWRHEANSPSHNTEVFHIYRAFLISIMISTLLIITASYSTVIEVNAVKYFQNVSCGQITLNIHVGKVLYGLQLATMSIQAIFAAFTGITVLSAFGNWL